MRSSTSVLTVAAILSAGLIAISSSCAQRTVPEPVGTATARSETEPSAGDASPPSHEIWANRELHKPPPLDDEDDVRDFVSWAISSARVERDDVYDSLDGASDKPGVVSGLIAEVAANEQSDNGRAVVAMSLIGAMKHVDGTTYMSEYLLRPLPSNGPLANGDFETSGFSIFTGPGPMGRECCGIKMTPTDGVNSFTLRSSQKSNSCVTWRRLVLNGSRCPLFRMLKCKQRCWAHKRSSTDQVSRAGS